MGKLCDHLERMAQLISQRGIGLDPRKTAFLSKVRPVLETSTGDEQTKRLIDVVPFVISWPCQH